jgi:hypothetical protein
VIIKLGRGTGSKQSLILTISMLRHVARSLGLNLFAIVEEIRSGLNIGNIVTELNYNFVC